MYKCRLEHLIMIQNEAFCIALEQYLCSTYTQGLMAYVPAPRLGPGTPSHLFRSDIFTFINGNYLKFACGSLPNE